MFGCSELEVAERGRRSLAVVVPGRRAVRQVRGELKLGFGDVVKMRCSGFSYGDVLVAGNLKTRWRKGTVFENGIYLPKRRGHGPILLVEYERVLKKGKVDKKLLKKAVLEGFLLHVFHEISKKKAKTRKRLEKKVAKGIAAQVTFL